MSERLGPGIYDIPGPVYHADPCETPSLSNSVASLLIEKSPLHAMLSHPRLNPAYVAEEKTTFDLGSAAHALFLEGEDRMLVLDYDDFRKKEAQQERDEARANGLLPVLRKHYDDIAMMARHAGYAIMNCSDAKIDMADGDTERTIIWREPNGVLCRCRPDWLRRDNLLVFDYKTTTSAEPGQFSRQIARMAYHFQDAWYRRGVKLLKGQDLDPDFIFMAQENTAPYQCSFHGIAPSLREIADQQVEQAIRIWGDCLKRNVWPGYSQRVHWAEAKSWQIDEELERAEGIPYDPAKMWDKNT